MQIDNGRPVQDEITNARQRLHLRIPFLRQETGLGDVIHRGTAALGIPQCGGCKKRQEMLNQVLRLNPWNT